MATIPTGDGRRNRFGGATKRDDSCAFVTPRQHLDHGTPRWSDPESRVTAVGAKL